MEFNAYHDRITTLQNELNHEHVNSEALYAIAVIVCTTSCHKFGSEYESWGRDYVQGVMTRRTGYVNL
jgi:hypothetical protein